jgi:transposase
MMKALPVYIIKRRSIMTVIIDRVAPVAHLPLVLGVLRKLGIAELVDSMIPPHLDQRVSAGRAVEALVLAILDGHHALYKVGRRLDERGMLPLLQPGLEPHSLHDTRLGQTLDSLFDANLHQVFSAIALRALETYQVETPWIHQDTTTISFYGAYEDGRDDGQGPRPTYGYSKDGRGDLKQVLLSLGVSSDGGLPLRMGLHDGNTSDSVDVPRAIEQSLALNLEGLRGLVADSKAYSQRTLGLCLESGMGLVTLVPHTCGIRQEVETWGQHQVSLPLLLERPAKRQGEAPRRWYGRSVTRQVKVEYQDGQSALAPIRFIAVYSTQLAKRHQQTHSKAQTREAEALSTHVAQAQRRQFVCQADAESAIAEYEGRGPGRRGRAATPWRYHEVGYQVEVHRRPQKRTKRGRPRKDEIPLEDIVYELRVTTQALPAPVKTFGWLTLATTIDEASGDDTEIVQAYRDQTTTVERGFRWIKNPAAITPVWLEKRKRIAALAMLTVVGLLVYSLIQRQVRQYLQAHQVSIPGNKGETDIPTATVVFESFATLTRVDLSLEGMTISQIYGWQAHHELICQALELDDLIHAGPTTQENNLTMGKGP